MLCKIFHFPLLEERWEDDMEYNHAPPYKKTACSRSKGKANSIPPKYAFCNIMIEIAGNITVEPHRHLTTPPGGTDQSHDDFCKACDALKRLIIVLLSCPYHCAGNAVHKTQATKFRSCTYPTLPSRTKHQEQPRKGSPHQ